MNTQTQTPRFRNDLVTQPIEDAGQRFVDVTDPDSGSTFRFYEVEYAIATAMNGKRDVRGLADWALEELGLETTSQELQTVITTLDHLGYLEGSAPSEIEPEPVELGKPGGSPQAPVGAAAEAVDAGPVELGSPGKSPIARERPKAPPAESLELGKPGGTAEAATGGAPAASEQSFEGLLDEEPPTAVRKKPDLEPPPTPQTEPESDFMEGITPPPAEVPSAKLRPSTEPASDDDGPTNLPPPAPGLEDEPEVSVDLSEHLSIDADDVKEAVRQSQVMKAVDVPDELLAEIEEEAAPPDAPPAKPESAPEAVAPAGSRPVELPEQRANVSERPEKEAPAASAKEAPPEPKKSGVSPVLLFLFLIVLLGGGAAWYFLVYKKQQDEGAGSSGSGADAPAQTQGTAGTAGTQQEPPEPEPVVAVLQEQEGAREELAAHEDALVTWMAEDGAQVAAGDPVIKLKGVERLEDKIAHLELRIEHYQEKADRASQKLAQADEAAKATWQEKLDYANNKVSTKKETIAEHEAEIEKLTYTATDAGTVLRVGKPGWVKKDDPLVEIVGPPTLSATFALPAEMAAPAVGDSVKVTPAAGGDASVDCEVTALAGSDVTVECAAGGALESGMKVELES